MKAEAGGSDVPGGRWPRPRTAGSGGKATGSKRRAQPGAHMRGARTAHGLRVYVAGRHHQLLVSWGWGLLGVPVRGVARGPGPARPTPHMARVGRDCSLLGTAG